MIIAGSGHRPNKLGGYSIEVQIATLKLAVEYLKIQQPSLVISGMAQGWDTAIAQAAINLDIPFDAYIPFVGQEQVWPQMARLYYKELLKRARTVRICSPGGYISASMTLRNRLMVDDCDKLVVLWDGSSGGTGNCINYADFLGRPYENLWSKFKNE